MKSFKLILFILFFGFGLSAYSQNTNADVVSLVADDAGFLKLKDTAQAQLPRFISKLQKYGRDTTYRFIVKSDFKDGDIHEHMWSVVVICKDKILYGIMVDEPVNVKNIKTGDKVEIKQEDIEDWAIYDNSDNIIDGNFSEKYLRDKQSDGKEDQ